MYYHFLLIILPLTCFAQVDPGLRNAHSMVYHEADGAVYLFGGATDREVKGDLWMLKKGEWSKLPATGPTPRTFTSLVYDDSNERLILFGGSKVLFGSGPNPENVLNDTWVFEKGDWREIATKNRPSARAEAAMCYDSRLDRVVMFGGYVIEGKSYLPVGDTWAFDGQDWEQISTIGPSKRNNASMVYHSVEDEVVLFGGSTGRNGYGENKGETWVLTDTSWNRYDFQQPPNIFNAAMAIDDKGIVRFGGWNGKTRIAETWRMTKEGWSLVKTKRTPSARNHTSMAYDSKNGKVYLYGGHDGSNVFGDLWSFGNDKWKNISKSPPRKRISNGH